MNFLIESIEHTYKGRLKRWWGPSGGGYVENINEAGRYSEAEAKQICERAGPENEKAWSEQEVYGGEAGEIGIVILNGNYPDSREVEEPGL